MRKSKVDIFVKYLMLQMLNVTQFSKAMTKGLYETFFLNASCLELF